MPSRYKSKPFHINNDKAFLTGSLALSSGCLIFTSLYKLLPKAHTYLRTIPQLKHSKGLLNATEFTFYFIGIITCSLLNLIIHMLTSESLVHCAHEGETHQHNHNANTEISGDLDNDHSHSHNHGHSENHNHSHQDHEHILPGNLIDHHPESVKVTEINNPTHPNVPTKSVSLLDLSIKAIKGEQLQGDCYGDLDYCASDIVSHSKLHHDEHNENAKLHFCTRPTDDNILFIDNDHLITNKAEFNHMYPDVDLNSPLLDDNDKISKKDVGYGSVISHDNIEGCDFDHDHSHLIYTHDLVDTEDEFEDDGDANHERHHHHIKTPLSRLLSIGIQTIVAITFHKFPEGFIMYATSRANPELGLMIFISMFIHNFVEGFTMTLPIYVAIGSRWKAILISGTLGSLAQPIGALLGWLTFRGGLDMDDNFSIVLIGGLIAMTSGFLTFISLQMFSSAIGFGGKQEKVMKWCFTGIFLICLSDVLI